MQKKLTSKTSPYDEPIRFAEWEFSGEEIRAIMRFSVVLRRKVLSQMFEISEGTFSRYLHYSVFPSEMTKKIAMLLNIETPEELRAYYDSLPACIKERCKDDQRIDRYNGNLGQSYQIVAGVPLRPEEISKLKHRDLQRRLLRRHDQTIATEQKVPLQFKETPNSKKEEE